MQDSSYNSAAHSSNKDSAKIEIINDFIENQITTLKSRSFDFIILSSLLHEVQNPKEFLESIISLMQDDTILHINVPNAKSFHLLWAYESGLISQIGSLSDRAKSLQQHSSFNIDSLITMATNASLEVLSSGSYFIKPFNHTKMSLALQNGILDSSLLQGLEKMIKYAPHLGAEIYINARVAQR